VVYCKLRCEQAEVGVSPFFGGVGSLRGRINGKSGPVDYCAKSLLGDKSSSASVEVVPREGALCYADVRRPDELANAIGLAMLVTDLGRDGPCSGAHRSVREEVQALATASRVDGGKQARRRSARTCVGGQARMRSGSKPISGIRSRRCPDANDGERWKLRADEQKALSRLHAEPEMDATRPRPRWPCCWPSGAPGVLLAIASASHPGSSAIVMAHPCSVSGSSGGGVVLGRRADDRRVEVM
jgi:hypothetical protein